MRPKLALGVAVLSALTFAGCSDDSEDPASTSPSSSGAVPALEKCNIVEGDSGSPTAANWRGSVSGISCEAAGKLIINDFVIDFNKEVLGDYRYTKTAYEKSQPGSFESAGFQCRHEAHSEEDGWALQCEQGEQVTAFYLTP